MKRTALSVLLVAAALVPAAVPAEQARLGTPAQLLEKPVAAVNLSAMPLLKVFNHLSDLSGLPIVVDWATLKGQGLTKETPISIRTERLAFEKVLNVALEKAAPKGVILAWRLHEGEVQVSTQQNIMLRNQFTRLAEAAARPAAGEAAPAAPVAATGGREMNFAETPLKLALEFLADVSGVSMHVNWKTLQATGITAETPISVKAQSISISRALDLVLDQVNANRDRLSSVYWVVDEGVVEISTGDALNRTYKTRIYDVADLLMPVPNFKGPRLDLASSTGTGNTGNTNGGGGIFGSQSGAGGQGQTATTVEEDDVVAQRQALRDGLTETIKQAIGEDMWAPTGKGTVRILRDKLIINQTPLGFKLLETAFGR